MKASKVLVNIDGCIAHPMIQTYGQYSIKYIFGGSKRVQLQHQALLTSIETIF